MLRKILIGIMMLLAITQVTYAEENNSTIADTREVPEDIYTYIFSTDRANYFFNHQQINYEVSEEGFINLNVLIVPTICMYDEIQIEDVVTKRRWNMQSLKGYESLVGRADYLEFNFADETVRVTERIELDEQWGTLSSDKNGQVIKLKDLRPNSVECRLYRQILNWAKKNNEKIIKHSWGKLTAEDKTLAEEDMPLMKLEF